MHGGEVNWENYRLALGDAANQTHRIMYDENDPTGFTITNGKITDPSGFEVINISVDKYHTGGAVYIEGYPNASGQVSVIPE